MTQTFDFYGRDYLKFYLLRETESDAVSFQLAAESDAEEMDFRELHAQGKTVYRFHNFNVSEDTEENCVTFRPNAVGEGVQFFLSADVPVRAAIIRNGSSSVAHSIELPTGETQLVLMPQGIEKYELQVESQSSDVKEGSKPEKRQGSATEEERTATDLFEAGFEVPVRTERSAFGREPEIGQNTSVRQQLAGLERENGQLAAGNAKLEEAVRELEKKKAELEQKNEELSRRKKNLLLHLDRLQEEYEKDYAAFGREAEELTATYDIDAKLLSFYAGKEVTPAEELIREAEQALFRLEEQIQRFVKAQEKKMADIEKELK